MWTLLVGVALAGKPSGELAAGEQMLLAGDAASALAHLDRALVGAKGADLARAHALRARARVLVLPDDPKHAEPAVADVLAARAADPKGAQAKLIEDTAAEVRGTLTQLGAARFSADPAGARPLLEQALRLDEAQLAPHEMLCSAAHPLAAPELADAHCDRAMVLADRPEETPDPQRALAAVTLALRHLQAVPPDPASAEAAIGRGLVLLDALRARREGARDLYDEAGWEANQRVEARVRTSLEELRANVGAVATAGPLAKADALTRAGRTDEAITAWKEAITAMPESVDAHFGLAALYLNQAVGLAERYNATDDPAEAERLLAQVLERFRSAKPLLETARRLAPQDPAVLGALKQACTQLKDPVCLGSLPK